MLCFLFICDNQPNNNNQINAAGGIKYEEFVEAQKLKIIESHLDYYGKFRWISQNVQQKRALLTPAVEAVIPNLSFYSEAGVRG